MEDNIMEMEAMETTENAEMQEPIEESGNGIVGKVVGTVLTAAALSGGVLWWLKGKEKREAKKIEKLRKKGYVIYKPEEVEEVEEVVETVDDEE